MKSIMKIGYLITFFAAFSCCGEDIVGQWNGVLDVGRQKLNLIAEFTQSGEKLGGNFYSVDQGNVSIPMTSAEKKGNKITFEISSLNIKFRGSLSGEKIRGKFYQNGFEAPLIFVKSKDAQKIGAISGFDIKPDTLALLKGKWEASLKVDSKNELKLVLVFEESDSNKCKSYLISVNQGEAKIPVDELKVEKSKIKISIKSLGITIVGNFVKDTIDAKFKQGAIERKLTFGKQ